MYGGVDYQSPFPGQAVGHACAFETSVMLHLFPEHVRTDKYPPEVLPRTMAGADEDVSESDFTFEHVTGWPWRTRGYGHIGNPSKADPEKGREIFEAAVENMTAAFDFICALDASRINKEEAEQQIEKPPDSGLLPPTPSL